MEADGRTRRPWRRQSTAPASNGRAPAGLPALPALPPAARSLLVVDGILQQRVARWLALFLRRTT